MTPPDGLHLLQNSIHQKASSHEAQISCIEFLHESQCVVYCGVADNIGSVVFLFNTARAGCPRVLMENLRVRLISLEGKLQTAADEGIMAEADANYIAQFERGIGRWVSSNIAPTMTKSVGIMDRIIIQVVDAIA